MGNINAAYGCGAEALSPCPGRSFEEVGPEMSELTSGNDGSTQRGTASTARSEDTRTQPDDSLALPHGRDDWGNVAAVKSDPVASMPSALSTPAWSIANMRETRAANHEHQP